MSNDLIIELSTLLNIDSEKITNSSILINFDGWDSFTALSFIAVVHKKTGQVISGEQISNCKTVADLLSLVHEPFH